MEPYFSGLNFGVTTVVPGIQEGWTSPFHTDTTKKEAMLLPEKDWLYKNVTS